VLDTQSWALFGQVEYDFTPTLTGIAGLRYTDEQRQFELVSGPSFFEEFDVTDELEEDAWTGRLGLDWRPIPDTLMYASLSTGFKSGGYNGSYVESPEPVGAEDITNFELGYKGTLAEGRIRLNAAAFAYEVEDYQAQVFLTVGEGSVITNAGDLTGLGAELELTAQLTPSFEVIAGLGWLDTEFSSDQIFDVAGDEYSLDGNETPSAPAWTYNLVARYYQELGDRGELTYQVDYAWQDDHFLQLSNDPYSFQEGYGLANAKLSWTSPGDKYTLSAFVNNLTDEQYFTYQNTWGPIGVTASGGSRARWVPVWRGACSSAGVVCGGASTGLAVEVLHQRAGPVGKYAVHAQRHQCIPFLRVIGGIDPRVQAPGVGVHHQLARCEPHMGVEGVGLEFLAATGVVQWHPGNQSAPAHFR